MKTMKIRYKRIMKLLPAMAILISVMARAQESGESGVHVRPDGGKTGSTELVASVENISGESLRSYPDILLSNSLQGKSAGLIVRMTNNGLGNNEANLFIRGLSTSGNAQAMVIVDGIERPFDDLLAEEIERIEVLKDAPAKILYGPSAANGVLVVTTKRGVSGKQQIRVNAESGVMQATRMPSYLNSYDYATLYNEARANDGLPALYQPYQLEGYRNSTGVNDVLYPDVDYYNYFLKKQSIYKKATLEANGGHKALKYALVAGYLNGGGFENIGESADLTRLNLRGNLDIEVTDYLSVVADVAGRMENRGWGAINSSGIFTQLSTTYPNEYPLTIGADVLGLTPNENGVPYFGTSLRKGNNLLAEMQYRGMSQERYITSQTNVGLDFDFGKRVKGLTASAFITFDNYTYVRQELRENFETYAVRTYLDDQGNEQVDYPLVTKLAPSDDITAADDATRRTIGWRGNVGYQNSFGDHHFSAMAGYRFYRNEMKGASQDVINCNYNLRLNYDYAKKYLLELTTAYMGNNKFAPGKRFFLSPAIGAGWVMSNEDFLSDNEHVDFLKLKASYGMLGYSGNTDYWLYNTAWGADGTIALNEGNTSNAKVVNLIRLGNPNLKWERSQEFNVGFEGLFMDKRLRASVEYFNEKRMDIIGSIGSLYSDQAGTYMMQGNIGSVRNQGIDGTISWTEKKGELQYRAGLNFTISNNKLLTSNELGNIPEADLRRIGKPTDGIYGLQSLGFLGRDVDINNAPVQKFGPYGDGDLAYADRNGDGIVDDRDEMLIGNNFPLTVLGIDLELNYRGWGLYVLGTSELGVNKMLTNSYYWNTGAGKYSTLAMDRYHAVNNPGGSYPALTTTPGVNSYRNSDFWIANASFFRLKNIELSYTLKPASSKLFSKGIKIFARGTNVFVISGIKDLDPEALDAGVTNNPITAFYTGGVSFTF